MSRIGRSKETDISDVRTDAGVNPTQPTTLSPTILPIRGEKRIIPSPISPADAARVFQEQFNGSGQPASNQKAYANTGRNTIVDRSDFFLKAAMEPYVDYVIIRLPHRGVGTDKQPDANLPAVYRFLINPSAVSVGRSTLDTQAMTRAGWQIGVWGEDSIQITLSGKTAGQYWSFGITDRYQSFTESYRNLQMLQVVFENNGYWFEGEQAGEGPLAADFARRRIKMHQDVELTVGNFVWYGMFETLTIAQSADEPWLASFSLTFIAWKERFRNSSPYHNLIQTSIQRGHSYDAWLPAGIASLNGIPSNAAQNLTNLLPPPSVGVQEEVSRAGVNDPSAVDYSPPPTRNYFSTHENH